MNVAGHEQKPDPWRARTDEVAAECHYDADEVYAWWGQLWMMRVSEQRWPRRLAKWQALHDARWSLDRRGRESD